MKIRISNYTFDASEKTITFGDYANISLDAVLLVVNVTDDIIIYNFTNPSKGGSVATNVLTLTYNTTSMADGDDLLIYYDDEDATASISAASLPLPTGAATEAKQLADGHNVNSNNANIATQTTLASALSALQTIDNFISGTRGLVTEDNSAAIKTAVEILDNAISGTEMQVDVVAPLPAGTNAIGKLASNSGVDIGDVDVTTLPNVKPNALKVVNRTKYDVDASAVLVVDASAHATMTSVIVGNGGAEDIYIDFNSSVASTQYMKKLAPGETWEFPLGYTSDATNDLYAIRASAQANDDVVVIKMGEV